MLLFSLKSRAEIIVDECRVLRMIAPHLACFDAAPCTCRPGGVKAGAAWAPPKRHLATALALLGTHKCQNKCGRYNDAHEGL